LAGLPRVKDAQVKKLLVAIALLSVSLGASAIPFQSTYTVNLNTSGSGLQVVATPTSGDLAFDLAVGESTAWTWLFDIRTIERTVNTDDRIPIAASIDWDFMLPTTFGGTSNGDTEGVSLFWGLWQFGVLTWDNGGSSSLYFGDGGVLDVYLEDVIFGSGLGGLSRQSAAVHGKFTLREAPAPSGVSETPVPMSVSEPAALALIGVGLLLLACVFRLPRNEASAASA
jgi:hypothetical protein